MTRSTSLNAAINFPEVRGNVGSEIESFDERMARDPEWAMTEGSKFFEDRGAVQEALQRITSKLNELGIDYAVVGGMALFSYGVRRFTEDVDLLVTREGLKEIHRQLDGLGYVPPFERSKNLRDAEHGVRIEFLVTGDFPGDGKPKPVAFPHPQDVAVEKNGIRYVKLPALIELKLASGLTNASRLKDLSDVIELIKAADLPLEFADSLNPYVREKYAELWQAARPAPKRYARLMPKGQDSGEEPWRAMAADGVVPDASRESDRFVYLVTDDPELAKKHGLFDESEMWDENEAGDDEERSS